MEVFGVGIIGCGNISGIYLHNLPKGAGLELRGVADIMPAAAKAKADEHGVPAYTVDQILARDDIQIILNLTIPDVHAQVSSQIVAAGKHVYSEKPLGVDFAETKAMLEQADAAGLRVSCAPDTFLGAGARTARKLIADGVVGDILSGQITIMNHGHEHWHPSPGFYYLPGGGPVMDMLPYYLNALINLIGPVRRVRSVNSMPFAERLVTSDGPLKDQKVPASTPTTLHSLLEFENGAQIISAASFDVWKHGNTPIELHGSKGSIRVPDPNHFGGDVALAVGREDWKPHDTGAMPMGVNNWPLNKEFDRANYRAAGVAEMAMAIREDRPHRANGALALHVLEVMLAIVNAKADDGPTMIETTVTQPDLLTEDQAAALFA